MADTKVNTSDFSTQHLANENSKLLDHLKDNAVNSSTLENVLQNEPENPYYAALKNQKKPGVKQSVHLVDDLDNADKYIIRHKFGEHVREGEDIDETELPPNYIEQTFILQFCSATPNTQRKIIEDVRKKNVAKLSPAQTYFSLLKGFVCTGILYLPKNFRNGGWAWAFVAMVLSFFLTLTCMVKLLECKSKVPGGSFTDIGMKAMGLKGKYMVDIFLSLAQIGFVTAYIYFIITSLHSVMLDAFGIEVSRIWFGVLCFAIYAPLCLVRKIEKFSITHIFADALIMITTVVILVYATRDLSNDGWGKGIMPLNTATWLDMIGSAVYSYEGIGVVLPLLEVTQKPEMYPKILLYVLLTVMILYVSFGEYCLFIYGDKLVTPLITDNLPQNAVVYIIKIFFSINLVFTYPLQLHPASVIIESYIFKDMPKSKKRMWLKNLTRTLLVLFTVIFCLSLQNSLDKFISVLGSLACTPISFTLPCLFHLRLFENELTQRQKNMNYFIIVLSIFITFFCTGFTIWNWNA